MNHEKQDDWRRWDRFEWNRRLIHHFFSLSPTNTDPVVRLDVSWLVLAHLTGDITADPQDVSDQFLARIRGSLGDEAIGSFIATRTGLHQGLPTSFVYLFTTCLAASEAQEDREDEGEVERNFREALCTMLDNDRHAAGLDRLAEAWERFADWTAAAERSGTFRRLALPKVGSETQIGYSKRLVFPRLRDQMKLAQLLERTGMVMEDPPVALLMQRLYPLRNEMTGELRAAFDELVPQVESLGDESNDPGFLIAVNSVARNAELLAGSASTNDSLTLLLYDYADTVELIVASSGPGPFDGAITVFDDFLPAEWPYRVTEVSDGSDALTSLFDPGTTNPLTWAIHPGVVPFAAGDHGVPEFRKRGRLEDAGHVLVRSERLEQFCVAFGIPDQSVRPSPLEEWMVIRDPGLRPMPAEELQKVGLSDVLVLHPRPIRNQLHLRDGYRALGDYLGFQLTVPWISARNAIAVSATLDGTELELKGGSGRWSLPKRDLFGSLTIRAEFPVGNALEKTANLISEPTGLEYKPPSNENDWMQETLAGTSVHSLATSVNVAEVEQEIPDGMHRTYLGPVVGEFLPSSDGAIYELASFGEIKWVRLLGPPLSEPPISRVADKGLCRRWRKALNEFLPYADSGAVAQAIRRAKAATTDLKTLSVVVSDRGHQPQVASAPPPHNGCMLVQAAVGTVCSRRAGMPIRDWNSLLERTFSLPINQLRLVHRAWLEAGLIDELRQIRWQGSAIFARNPVLMTFRVGKARFGSVDGLVMPSRLTRLHEVAANLGLSTSLNSSPSPYLPARLMVRSDDDEMVDEFAKAAQLHIQYLDSEPLSPVRRRDLDSREIPAGYRPRRAFPTFPPPEDVNLTMHQRSDAPPFWSASVDGHGIWSYSPEAMSFWIRRASGYEVAKLGDGAELEPVGSFLPLSLARWLAIVSGINPGPRTQGSYINPAPSRHLVERVLGDLASLSSPQLTPGGADD